MLELFGFVPSRSNRPHWALEEIGADYAFIQLDFQKGDHRSDAYLCLNPAGKVPTLRDGDFVISESAAICNYLGEKYPESALIPPVGTPKRAHYDQWLYFVMTELEQPLWTKGKHSFALPEHLRVPAVIETAIWEFGRAAELLAKGLGDRDYMIGTSFTMVDIAVAHTLVWANKFKFPIEHENLRAYADRMTTRPAFGRIAKKEPSQFPR